MARVLPRMKLETLCLHGGTQHCRLGSNTYVWTPDAAATATTDGSPSVVSRGFQFRKASDCAGLAEAMTTVTRGGAAASQFDSTRADSRADAAELKQRLSVLADSHAADTQALATSIA